MEKIENINICKINETIKDGRMYRECSHCKKDITQITMSFSYNYCPWCGFKIRR